MNRTTSAPAPDMVFNKGSLLECSFGEGSFILNFFWNKHVSEPAQPRGPKKKEKKILQPPWIEHEPPPYFVKSNKWKGGILTIYNIHVRKRKLMVLEVGCLLDHGSDTELTSCWTWNPYLVIISTGKILIFRSPRLWFATNFPNPFRALPSFEISNYITRMIKERILKGKLGRITSYWSGPTVLCPDFQGDCRGQADTLAKCPNFLCLPTSTSNFPRMEMWSALRNILLFC